MVNGALLGVEKFGLFCDIEWLLFVVLIGRELEGDKIELELIGVWIFWRCFLLEIWTKVVLGIYVFFFSKEFFLLLFFIFSLWFCCILVFKFLWFKFEILFLFLEVLVVFRMFLDIFIEVVGLVWDVEGFDDFSKEFLVFLNKFL